MTRAALVLFVLLGMTASAQDMLPKNGAVAGWTRKDPPRTFVSTQLWEYMDGGADVYLDHGFRKVHTVEMTREKKDVLIDVFEFGSVDQAFGMYAQERPATPSPVAVGTEGYAQGNTLAFYHGMLLTYVLERHYCDIFVPDYASGNTIPVSKHTQIPCSWYPLVCTFIQEIKRCGTSLST